MIENEKIIENMGSGGGQITVVLYKKGYAVKRYCGAGEQVLIPSMIDQKPVTAIE